jgi:hypothetical protein
VSLENPKNKAAYFYPVQSVIFIEQETKQYAILSDEKLGASVYQPGNIEFIVLRQGLAGEDLVEGRYTEALSDFTEDSKGINITYKFQLAITESRN